MFKNEKIYQFIKLPLGLRTKYLVAILSLSILSTFVLPIWEIQLHAPQYPKGLELSIYTYKIEGGNNGQHIDEINTLNHYIGMASLDRERLKDLDWIPLMIGLLSILGLRISILGTFKNMIDLLVFSVYFSLFAFARFVYQLYSMGHSLNPEAPVKVEPFMPVIIGKKQIANFVTYSYPGWGSFFLGLFVLGIAAIIIYKIVHFKKHNLNN